MTAQDDDPSKQDDEVTIVQPPNTLATKVQKMSGSLDDLLGNSEKMLAGMKTDFHALMDRQIADLPALYSRQWQPVALRAQGAVALGEAARAIKGQSGSFGFDLLGEIADLFSEYLADTPMDDQKSAAILSYIDSLQIIWRQKIAGDGGALGQQMIDDLKKLNRKAAGGA